MKKPIMNSKLAAILLVIGAAALVLGIKIDATSFLGVICLLIWAATFTVGISWFAVGRKWLKNQTAIYNSNEFYFYDAKSGVLTLKKRSPQLADYVIISADKDVSAIYNPVKVHIGGATVGGVTTGGVYTTGGNYSVSSVKKSGYYPLLCKYGGEMIKKIAIPKEEIINAKKSSISQYFNAERAVISVIDDIEFSDYERVANLNTFTMTGGFSLDKSAKRGYPSYEKSLSILNWICNKE